MRGGRNGIGRYGPSFIRDKTGQKERVSNIESYMKIFSVFDSSSHSICFGLTISSIDQDRFKKETDV